MINEKPTSTDKLGPLPDYSPDQKDLDKNKSRGRKDRDFATKIDVSELIRYPHSQDEELDKDYINNQSKVRELFVDSILDGTLYSGDDPNVFIEKLKEAHRLANENGVYTRISKKNLNENQIGVFRPSRSTTINRRKDEAIKVSQIAQRYSDPYFDRGSYYKEKIVVLENIDFKNLPWDFLNKKNVYAYWYPPAEAIPQYMKQMNILGKKIVEAIDDDNVDNREILKLIAKQYQYGAIIRPFVQVNNSLFMNLVNAQLKLLGYNGIPHGDLDFAAQRLQTANFVKYFIDEVLK